MARLAPLLGEWEGAIVGPKRRIRVQVRYERAMNGNAVRARGLVHAGGEPLEFEDLMSWDPVSRSIVYVEFEGELYNVGTVTLEGNAIRCEFRNASGKGPRNRVVDRLRGPDTFVSTASREKDGAWKEFRSITFWRVRSTAQRNQGR